MGNIEKKHSDIYSIIQKAVYMNELNESMIGLITLLDMKRSQKFDVFEMSYVRKVLSDQ